MKSSRKKKRKPKQNKTKINVKKQVTVGFTIHITIESAGRAGTRRALSEKEMGSSSSISRSWTHLIEVLPPLSPSELNFCTLLMRQRPLLLPKSNSKGNVF